MNDGINRRYEELVEAIGKVVVGHRDAINELLIAFFAGGHVLIEGVPGIAKTLTVKVLARLLGCDFKRIQFTPDLMPSDVTGTNIFNMKSGEFLLKKGPIFTNILLADEVNRTPPKTQAALLEAMEERQVTIDGVSYRVPHPFMVLATQNPLEYEGTYPLPEAQVDRFMMKIIMGYPSLEEEDEILRRDSVSPMGGFFNDEAVSPIMSAEEIDSHIRKLDSIIVDDKVIRYISEIVRNTRNNAKLLAGASPRAGVMMLRAAKASALFDERDYAIPDDVKRVAAAVLRHRLILKPEAEIEGFRADDITKVVLDKVDVPR
jgi:MoxR-like ATPase